MPSDRSQEMPGQVWVRRASLMRKCVSCQDTWKWHAKRRASECRHRYQKISRDVETSASETCRCGAQVCVMCREVHVCVMWREVQVCVTLDVMRCQNIAVCSPHANPNIMSITPDSTPFFYTPPRLHYWQWHDTWHIYACDMTGARIIRKPLKPKYKVY